MLNALMDPAQLGQSIGNAFQMGMQQRQQRETQNALADYAKNQNSQTAAAVVPFDPALGIQLQDREADRQKQLQVQQQQAHQAALDQLGKVSQLAKWIEAQPDKEAAYQQAIAIAKQAGIDTSQAPPNYDPAWVHEQATFADVFMSKPQEMTTEMQNIAAAGYKPGSPEFQHAMRQAMAKFVPMQQGGAIGQMTPGEGFQMVVQPNPGGMQAGTPAIPQEAVDALRRGEGTPAQFDEMFGQGAAARIMGGGGGNATGGFPNIAQYYSGQ